MATDIGQSASRVYKHYKKHYDDIFALIEMTGLPRSTKTSGNQDSLPDDFIGLVAKADQSLEEVKKQIGDIDEIAAINPSDFQTKKPSFCSALTSYQKDLEILFSAIQSIRSKAPKPKRKSGGKARTKKF